MKYHVVMVTGLTTVLTHMSGRPVIPQHDKIKIIVAILNGMSSVWTAAQLKLGLDFFHFSTSTREIQFLCVALLKIVVQLLF